MTTYETILIPEFCGDDLGLHEASEAGARLGRASVLSLAVVVGAITLIVWKRTALGIVIGSAAAMVAALVVVGAAYARMRHVVDDCDDVATASVPAPAGKPDQAAPAETDEVDIERLRTPSVVVTAGGIQVNGRRVAGPDALPQDDLRPIEPLAAVLHELDARLMSSGLRGPIAARASVAIDPDVPPLAAGSVLLTVARAHYREMTVRVATTAFRATYLFSSPLLPTESDLYFAPHAPSGFAVHRETITRNLQSGGPPCRKRSSSRVLASERDIDPAAAKLCGASTVDCIDHVVFALPAKGTFGETILWIAAALKTRPLSAPQLAFVVEGTDPFPDAIECADAGQSARRSSAPRP